MNVQFYLRKHLLGYLRLKLIIATKNLIDYKGDVIKQDVYATLQQKIELDQQDIDILVIQSHIGP